MTLQSRLSDLITAIGADVKDLKASILAPYPVGYNLALAHSSSGSAGMTDAGSAAYDATRAAANHTEVQKLLTWAATWNQPVYWPKGTWDIKGQLTYITRNPNMRGAGPNVSHIRFATGAGRVSGTLTGTGYTTETADGLGTGFMIGDNSTTYQNAGVIENFSVTSASGGAPTFTPSGGSLGPSTACAITLNGISFVTLRNIIVTNFGCGFDLINNSGGSRFEDCHTPYASCNVGVNIRQGTISGADISFYNCWLHGAYWGAAIERLAGDMWFQGGQLSGNVQNVLGLTSAQAAASTGLADVVGAVIFQRNALDGTIGPDGAPGTPTSGGGQGLITFRNVDFEGTRCGYAGFRAYGPVHVVFESGKFTCSNTSPGTDPVTGLVKNTGATTSVIKFKDMTVMGAFASSSLVRIVGAGVGSKFTDEDCYGTQNAFITGINSGALLTGDWLHTHPATGAITNLFRMSGIASTVNYRAVRGAMVDSAGTWSRGDGSGKTESSSDGITWATVGGYQKPTGGIPIADLTSSLQDTLTSGTGVTRLTDAAPINNTTTFVVDDTLVVPLKANTRYYFEVTLRCMLDLVSGQTAGQNTGTDIAYAMVVPAGTVGDFNTDRSGYGEPSGLASAATGVVTDINSAVGNTAALRDGTQYVILKGNFKTGSTAGNLSVKYSQGAATASNLTIREFSRMFVQALT